MFQGENLTNLRMMRGYSRKKLSEMLSITEQAVWQYENNYTSPKMEIVNNLKNIFHVKSKYFYKADALGNTHNQTNINMMNIAYRSKEINLMSKTQAEAKYMEFLDRFVDYLSSKISYPTQKVIQLRNRIIHYLNTSNDSRQEQIIKAAKLAREELGLGQTTNSNLMFLAEKSGIFIFEKAIGEEIDAYSVWTKQDRPFIILGNLKRSAARRNFDIAHELGHLLLHFRVEFTNLDRKEYKTLENEANQFAGAFLLPEQILKEELLDLSRPANPDAYLDLKKKWLVSLQVLGYQALRLNILDSKKHRNFYAALHRKGYLKQEPLDEALPIQRPQKIKSIIDYAVKEGIIDIQHMMDVDWMAETGFFYQLTGMEESFFRRYLQKKQNFELAEIAEISPNYG
ncbi:spr1629 family repressor/antitoxin [Oceanobacillus neutriphilus]|uniref:Transcriptional regulator n=1 Tax=Oceanobacillus neutriphilus TaxID=531815 RepID=A0ABQ2NT24_9BACI|nr:XRE family transcriptional regulator [Oceanobacillus neutriphilus]GGP10174.1 transcriptional regulator [Oceanobacillus neutriphilus]